MIHNICAINCPKKFLVGLWINTNLIYYRLIIVRRPIIGIFSNNQKIIWFTNTPLCLCYDWKFTIVGLEPSNAKLWLLNKTWRQQRNSMTTLWIKNRHKKGTLQAMQNWCIGLWWYNILEYYVNKIGILHTPSIWVCWPLYSEMSINQLVIGG